MSEIEAPLQRIKAWLTANLPQALSTLNAPATEDELQEVRTLLGTYTPPELLEFYAAHLGEVESGLFPDGMQLFDIALLAQGYEFRIENQEQILEPAQSSIRIGPVKSVFNTPKRVPFAWCNADVCWLIDLDPAPGGVVGQIVYEDQELDHLEVIAPSLSALLSRYAGELEQGLFAPDEEGYLASKSGRMFSPNYACN